MRALANLTDERSEQAEERLERAVGLAQVRNSFKTNTSIILKAPRRNHRHIKRKSHPRL